jgi:hypothetical protein
VTPDRHAIIERRGTFFAQELRVAWAEDPKRRPVRGVEARRRASSTTRRRPSPVPRRARGCAFQRPRRHHAGGGGPPADDRRELTAVQNRATGSRTPAMNSPRPCRSRRHPFFAGEFVGTPRTALIRVPTKLPVLHQRSHGDRLRVEELEEKARGLLGSLLR